jgi:benzodiazapine receptor
MKTWIPGIFNSIVFFGMVAVNALAVLLPINGMNTGQISDLYPSMFTPSGFTFGIWSLIYLWLLVFVIAQWFYAGKTYYKNLSWLFILSCLANMLWIVAWHYLLPAVSLVIMTILLFALVRIFLMFQDYSLSVKEKIFLQFPFHVYLGWISVATIANVATVLVNRQWEGTPLSTEAWTIIMLVIATLLSLWMTIRFKAIFYSLVTLWALYGIFSRWKGNVEIRIDEVAMYSGLLIAVAIVVTIISQLIQQGNRTNV